MLTNDTFEEILERNNTITVLTGAGVSTDSGVPDFKTIDHEWPFEVSRGDATSLEFFHKNPKKFWEAFRYIFTLKQSVAPNSFHKALASLEKTHEVIVLTQNVDGLHTLAGSSQVLELHGNIREVRCHRPSCDFIEPLNDSHDEHSRCPKCRKMLRPNVVMFGENPRGIGDAKQVSIEAGIMLVAGTALDVGPVNDLPRWREWVYPERETIWVNRTEAPLDYHFSNVFVGELKDFTKLIEFYVGERTLPLL